MDFLTKKFGLYFGQLIFSEIYKPNAQVKSQNQFNVNRQAQVYNQTDSLAQDNSNIININRTQAINRTDVDNFTTNNNNTNQLNDANISKSSSDQSEDWFFN